jgi:proteasome assembly chaperone (PAC2) family protein
VTSSTASGSDLVNVVTFLQRPRGLHRPVLVAAFQGWNDAGEAASGAARVLRRESSAQPFARIDPEEFFDFQATRPTVRIADGGMRRIDWPENTFSWAHLPGSRHDLVLLNGTEPNLRWVTFARGITDLVSELGIELVLTLGALQIDVPHSRPVPITGSASDAQLATRLRLRRSTYEGPTGITGVLHHACASAGVHAASLWAGVPHYLAAAPYLAGTLALAERVTSLLDADVSLARLAEDAAAQGAEIASLVAEDEELARYVAELEQRTEEARVGDDLPSRIVSGDELAAELERFLREHDD